MPTASAPRAAGRESFDWLYLLFTFCALHLHAARWNEAERSQPKKEEGPASNSRPKGSAPPARGRKGVSKSRKSWGVKLNRKSNARAQGTKRAPVRNVSSHTPAPVKSRNIFPPRSFPPLYKKGKKGYNNPANARFYRCVGRCVPPYAGGGVFVAPCPCFALFYCALRFYYKPIFSKFQLLFAG